MGRLIRSLLAAFLFLAAEVSASTPDRTSFEDELANLRSPNVGTRVKAARQLGRSGRLEAIPALTEATRDPESKVRKEVVSALREFKNAEAIDGLLIGLQDEESSIRSDALTGVLEIYVEPDSRGPLNTFLALFNQDREAASPQIEPFMEIEPRVVQGIEARLQDEQTTIRRQAAFALGLIRAKGAVPALTAALADPDRKVRSKAVEALGRIGTDSSGVALQAALADPSSRIRGEAVDALGVMRYRPAVQDLLRLYDAEQGKTLGDKALRALSLMGAPEARGIFYQNMTSAHPHRRAWAVEGLGRLGDTSLAKGLTKDFLREPDPNVQLAYCFALAGLGRPEFVDRLVLSLSDLEKKEQARDYLVDLGSPLLPELVLYLNDPVPEIRKEMALVLMRIGDPAAIPYLEPLVSDPNTEVADLANRAIARLQRVQMSAANSPTR